jgi:galactokinase
MNQKIVESIETLFKERFDRRPLIVRSPGRVNIIGEHTDYNDGFVLPAAIDKAIYVAIAPREDEKINLYSAEFHQPFESDLSSMKPDSSVWPNYIMGVADQLRKRNYPIKGFDLVIGGDVPIGSGLSSSAAVECSTAMALNELYSLNISKMDIALISQKAEQEFAGVMVGIMDQFASVFGKKDHVIKLDCRSLEYEYEPFRLEGYSILLLNTNVKHSLGTSEYNTRRQQCEEGVAMVRKKYPDVKSLRDATLPMLEELVAGKDELIFRRCKYVVEENQRLLEGCQDLLKGDIPALGKKMFRTHEGLSREYEVSCPELDFLVEAVKGNPDVLGARMMGGGFGGCTINIIKDEAIEGLIRTVGESYSKAMGKEMSPYIAHIENGTEIIAR